MASNTDRMILRIQQSSADSDSAVDSLTDDEEIVSEVVIEYYYTAKVMLRKPVL